MKILTIILIILLTIGIYTYAHVNRYQIFTDPHENLGILIKYDNWTDRAFVLIYSTDNKWFELRELSKEEKEKLKK